MKNKVILLLCCAISANLCAMDSVQPNPHKRQAEDVVAPDAKRVEMEKPKRDVPLLKAYTAAFIVRRRIKDHRWFLDEEFERYPNRYDTHEICLPEGLARYVHSMEICLSNGYGMCRPNYAWDEYFDKHCIHDECHYNFLCAAQDGNLDAMNLILSKCRTHEEYVHTLRVEEDRALKLAALHGQIQVVAFLLEQGVDVNAQNGAALYHAIVGCHSGLALYLLDHGANVRPLGGFMIQQAICKSLDPSLVRRLLEGGADILHPDLMIAPPRVA
jgi:hypothetical protein